MKNYPKVKDLPIKNRQHMAWRLDHKTACGLLTACKIARCEDDLGELPLNVVFETFGGVSATSAKIHATKTINFKS